MKKALLAIVAVAGLAWFAAPASADHFHRRFDDGHHHRGRHIHRHGNHIHHRGHIHFVDPWRSNYCPPARRYYNYGPRYGGGGLHLDGRNFSFGIRF